MVERYDNPRGQLVMAADYDALAARFYASNKALADAEARLAEAERLLRLASEICGGWRGEEIESFLRATDSATPVQPPDAT